MFIAITGISSKLGKSLIPKLQNDPSVERIIGIDINDYHAGSDKITFVKADIRDMARLESAFEGVDVLLHLAFIVAPARLPGRKTIYDININGTQTVFRAAAKKKVKKIIYLSSSSAYGHRPESLPVVTEASPLLGAMTTNFYYSHTKGLVEQFLDQFEKKHPDISITRVRASMFGHFDDFAKTMGRMRYAGKSTRRVFPLNHNGKIPWQLLLEDDLIDLLLLMLKKNVRGAYNIAGRPLPDLRSFIKDKYNHELKPYSRKLSAFLIGLEKIFPEFGWIQGWTYTSLLNTEKVEKEFGWKPTLSTEEILEKALA